MKYLNKRNTSKGTVFLYNVGKSKYVYTTKKLSEDTDINSPIFYKSDAHAVRNFLRISENELFRNNLSLSEKFVLNVPTPHSEGGGFGKLTPEPTMGMMGNFPSNGQAANDSDNENPDDMDMGDGNMDMGGDDAGDMPDMDTNDGDGDNTDSENDEGKDGLQELSGKISSALRDYSEDDYSDKAKYAINMIMAAVDTDKLSDEDKEAIQKKFNKKFGGDDSSKSDKDMGEMGENKMYNPKVKTVKEETDLNEYFSLDDLDKEIYQISKVVYKKMKSYADVELIASWVTDQLPYGNSDTLEDDVYNALKSLSEKDSFTFLQVVDTLDKVYNSNESEEQRNDKYTDYHNIRKDKYNESFNGFTLKQLLFEPLFENKKKLK